MPPPNLLSGSVQRLKSGEISSHSTIMGKFIFRKSPCWCWGRLRFSFKGIHEVRSGEQGTNQSHVLKVFPVFSGSQTGSKYTCRLLVQVLCHIASLCSRSTHLSPLSPSWTLHIKSYISNRKDKKGSYFKAFLITYFVNPINHHSASVSKGFILEYHCILIIESTATIDDHCTLVHFIIELLRV